MRKPVFLSIPAAKLKNHFHYVRRGKLNLEIQLDWNSLENHESFIFDELKMERDNHGMELTLHAPFIDMAPGAADPKMREATQARLKQTAELAEELGAKGIVVHPGWEERRYLNDNDGYVSRCVETWGLLLDQTEKCGCGIALENIYEKNPELLARVIEKVNSPRFGNCFDAGHFNVFSEISLDNWLDVMGRYITHLHLHNNYGKTDEHNGMKSGTFNFEKLFDALPPNGRSPILALEPHTENGVDESLEHLMELGMLDSVNNQRELKAV